MQIVSVTSASRRRGDKAGKQRVNKVNIWFMTSLVLAHVAAANRELYFAFSKRNVFFSNRTVNAGNSLSASEVNFSNGIGIFPLGIFPPRQ